MANLGGLLAGLGGGVTQAMQNYQQQRDSQMRNMLLNLYLKTQQSQSQANNALGGLDLGSLGGGDKGIAGLAGVGAGPSGMPSGMPAPTAPGPAMERPTGVMPLEDSPASAGMAAERGQTLDAPVLNYDVEREAAPPAPSATAGQPDPGMAPAGQQPVASGRGGDSAPAPAIATAAGEPGGGGLVAHLPGGGDVPVERLMGHRIGLAEVQKLIRTQRPDLDPETAWLATESLFKLVNQDNTQQRMYGLGILKELGVITGLGIRKELGEGNIAARYAGYDVRKQEGAANRGAAADRQDKGIAASENKQIRGINATNARQDKAIAEQRYQKAAAAASGQDKLALSEMHRQLADIKRRIDSIDTGPNATSTANKATREGLQKQYDDIAEREKKRAAHILGDAGE